MERLFRAISERLRKPKIEVWYFTRDGQGKVQTGINEVPEGRLLAGVAFPRGSLFFAWFSVGEQMNVKFQGPAATSGALTMTEDLERHLIALEGAQGELQETTLWDRKEIDVLGRRITAHEVEELMEEHYKRREQERREPYK